MFSLFCPNALTFFLVFWMAGFGFILLTADSCNTPMLLPVSINTSVSILFSLSVICCLVLINYHHSFYKFDFFTNEKKFVRCIVLHAWFLLLSISHLMNFLQFNTKHFCCGFIFMVTLHWITYCCALLCGSGTELYILVFIHCPQWWFIWHPFIRCYRWPEALHFLSLGLRTCVGLNLLVLLHQLICADGTSPK